MKKIIAIFSKRDAFLSLAILLCCAILVGMPDLYSSPYTQNVERAKGKVLSVNNDAVQQFGMIRQGDQNLVIHILDGPFKGEEVEAGNTLIGKMDVDKIFEKGDIVYLVLNTSLGKIVTATAYDHYRMDVQIFLFLLFVVLLFLFAGWTGFRAVLSFVFAVLMIWRVLAPGMILGIDPIFIALLTVALITIVTMLLVAGLTRTAFVAALGSLLGVMLTCGLSFILFPLFKLNGAMQPYSETLLYSGFPELNLDRIYLAAIFIGASGAVMDLAIDVAASMNEVWQKRPDLHFIEMVGSGLSVGRAMTSTMVTTLLMAYVSGFIALLMVFLSKGISPVQMINTGLLSSEILRTLVGSFGLVTVAPFTALVGGFVYTRPWLLANRPKSNFA
jgi:uncharacterized membrane protein